MTQSPNTIGQSNNIMECIATRTLRNLNETAETRSSVSIRVESIAIECTNVVNGPHIVTSSYRFSPPQFFSFRSFDINSTTTLSHIFHLLQEQEELGAELSANLASEIFYESTATDFDRNAINIDVLVRITLSPVSSVNIRTSLEGERVDEVEKLVRDGVIGEKLGLETESCSICLENLLAVSEKVPTRMLCSHIFHDGCISQWLRRKNSCPVCRRVLLERKNDH